MNTLQIYTALRGLIPAENAASWDNEGVMCLPDPDREIKRALVALDITDTVVNHAVREGYDIIVSHHPVIFKPLRRIDSPKLVSMIRAGISALSFHTSLDCADGGTADTLARLLKLINTEKLYDEGIPCGRVGKLENPLYFNELTNLVTAVTDAATLEVINAQSKRRYERIAVCPGDGKSLYRAALESGADAYICGAMQYNDLCNASERDMTVITAGHYATERPVCDVLARYLRKIGTVNNKLTVECDIHESNPVVNLSQEEKPQ